MGEKVDTDILGTEVLEGGAAEKTNFKIVYLKTVEMVIGIRMETLGNVGGNNCPGTVGPAECEHVLLLEGRLECVWRVSFAELEEGEEQTVEDAVEILGHFPVRGRVELVFFFTLFFIACFTCESIALFIVIIVYTALWWTEGVILMR